MGGSSDESICRRRQGMMYIVASQTDGPLSNERIDKVVYHLLIDKAWEGNESGCFYIAYSKLRLQWSRHVERRTEKKCVKLKYQEIGKQGFA